MLTATPLSRIRFALTYFYLSCLMFTMNEAVIGTIWKQIPNRKGYEISTTGYVRSFWRRIGAPGSTFDKWRWEITETPKPLSHSLNRKGYHMVRLQSRRGKQILVCVHKLML